MTGYQLSCGNWVTDWRDYRIGDLLPCTKCDTLRTTVVGYATGCTPCGADLKHQSPRQEGDS